MTRDQTWTRHIGRSESQSLDHQETPSFSLVVCIFIIRGLSASGFRLPSRLGGKNPPDSARDTGRTGSIPASGRPPAGGHGNPLQRSCLEKSMDRGSWRARVHGVTKSRTRLSMHIRSVLQQCPDACELFLFLCLGVHCAS